ncbi:lytic transglycosylase domain-containing protein [Microbacterium sp. AZCO]|uniref:aggregation-promoting factor C-terminal-like domain-containing protein n=1 Tax=Microbacterium sp. AZCO TaxID=3142976 RepID=UPI0031F3F771
MERRARRRPVLVAAAAAVGVLTIVGIAEAVPVSTAEASGSTPSFALASYSTPLSTTKATVAAADPTTSDAQAAVDAAAAAVTAAQSVTSDIASSGLDIGVADTTVDTTDLQAAAARLETGIGHLPEPFLPSVTDGVTALVTSANQEVASLRGSLDAAKALKAQQEAEEKARQEAAAAATAAAAAKAKASTSSPAHSSTRSSSAPSVPIPSGNGNGDNSPAGAQAFAHSQFASRGWGDDQFGCLVALWNKESGWNYQAYNRGSGAYGIPQALPGSKMGSAGADWQTNAATQVLWGLGYVQGRYGTPCGAWSHSQSTGWY